MTSFLELMNQKLEHMLCSEIRTSWQRFLQEMDARNFEEMLLTDYEEFVVLHREIISQLAEQNQRTPKQIISDILLELRARAEFRSLKERIDLLETLLSDTSVKAQIESRYYMPPELPEFFVVLFTKKRYRAGLLQCLEEDFHKDLAAGMSLRRARMRYWASALNTIGPQLWAAIKRVGVIGILADYVRGKLGGA